MPRIIQTFTDFGNRTWKNRLEGGNADEREPEEFPSDDLEIGHKVEREHVSNPDVATEIAMDHLSSDSEYYNKLITAGLADEEGAIDLFKKLKGKNAREKAKQDIIDYMEEEDDFYQDQDEIEDYDETEIKDDEYLNNFDEDELGKDKSDLEDEELIVDEDEPKNKKKVMEKNAIKNYKSFLKEANEIPPVEQIADTEPAPERKLNKENKYKFQLPYDKKVADKLNEYNFTYYVPDSQKEKVVKPSPSTHFIIIDMLNLNYSVIDSQLPDVRMIDSSRVKHLLEGL